MEKEPIELPLEEKTHEEVLLYVKWFGSTPNIYVVRKPDTYLPEADVVYKVSIPLPTPNR